MKYLVFSLFILYTLNGRAQGQEEPSDYEWFQAKYIKFKPVKAEAARKLLHDYLYKANEISGRLVLTFESDMGEWDHIAYLHFEQGPQQLAHEDAEIESKWWSGVLELAGSQQKAEALIEEYQSYILYEKHNLVRMRNLQEQLSRKP